MFKKVYILNFDVLYGDGFDYTKFHETLTTAQGLINWWHYLSSSYILIVDNTTTATSITNFVKQLAPNKNFFVCQLNLKDHSGWLPKEAWDWIAANINYTPYIS